MFPSATISLAINHAWDTVIIPILSRYIEIPCQSVLFDPYWQKNGYLDQAITLLADWCKAQPITGMTVFIHHLANRTPLLLIEIAGQTSGNVLLYGHMDKQPAMTGWQAELEPWKAVLKEGRLYGRGGADDGYAVFTALTAIQVLQKEKIPHARCVILIEGSEESGSPDLPAYMEYLVEQIGIPELVICLDSGAEDYNHLWCTTSLRGCINLLLEVEILTQGVHSGSASGIVPSSFRILRQLLSRIENEATGNILLPALSANIPSNRMVEAKKTAAIIQDSIFSYPWVAGARSPLTCEEALLNKTWHPTLCITGIDGIPPLNNAGNVLRPQTTAILSLRIPPTCDPTLALPVLTKTLTENPPYGAKITLTVSQQGAGWNAPDYQPWLASALDNASCTYFKNPVMYRGEGGSIPFMAMLSKKFPKAQYMVTGVLGPNSNAHGPNEFLHIETAKKLTACVSWVLAEHGKQK